MFIEELSKKINYSIEECNIINNILEDNFLIGKKNKDKIINELVSKLNINNDENEANRIYEGACEIIVNNIKEKIKHPLKIKIKKITWQKSQVLIFNNRINNYLMDNKLNM